MIYCTKQGRSIDSNRRLNPLDDRHLFVLNLKFSLTDLYLFKWVCFSLLFHPPASWLTVHDLRRKICFIVPEFEFWNQTGHISHPLFIPCRCYNRFHWTWNVPFQFPPLSKVGVKRKHKNNKEFVCPSMPRMWNPNWQRVHFIEMSLFLIIISSTSVMTYSPWPVEKVWGKW